MAAWNVVAKLVNVGTATDVLLINEETVSRSRSNAANRSSKYFRITCNTVRYAKGETALEPRARCLAAAGAPGGVGGWRSERRGRSTAKGME